MGHAPSVEVLDLISASLLLMRGLQGHSSTVNHESLRTLLEKATDALITYCRLDHQRIRCVERVPNARQSLHLRGHWGICHAVMGKGDLSGAFCGFMSRVFLHLG